MMGTVVLRILTVCGSLQRLSANRAAIDVASGFWGTDVAVEEFADLVRIPPFDPDAVADTEVDEWRARLAAADAVLFASPEYAGAIAGTLKNALDWIVGSGELYAKPVGVISAGTSGGVHARRMTIQTLTWQGAHVVAELGITMPRSKTDDDGAFVDGPTIAAINSLAATLVAASTMASQQRLALVHDVVRAAGVDEAHIAPLTDD
jgi:chromate reductase, NAD(P)H dehydrogenase (quinone)